MKLIRTSTVTTALALAALNVLIPSLAFAADDTWGANAGTAWYTVGNWASTAQFPGLQGAAESNADLATFSSAATATTFGINMNTASLNLGAIVFDSTRTTATNLGNSSSTVPGFLRLYGAPANSVANSILWNAGTGSVTLQAAQAGGGTMGVVLGNTTNVIQITNSGGITISSNITQINPNSGLTLQGSNTGILTLSGTNSYSGVTTIGANKILQFATFASLYNNTPGSWTAANLNVSGTLALNVGGANQFTASNVTTLLTNLGGLGGAVSSNGLRSGSRIAFDTSNAGGNFTVADNIANSTGTGGGAIGLTKLGSGALNLTGTNSHTGPTTITGGTLRVSSASIGTGSISLGGSSNNSVLASLSATPITIPGNISNGFVDGIMTFGDTTGTGAITLAGQLQLSGSGSGRTVNTAADVNVTGVLSGGNSSFLTKSGAATLTLSNVAGTTNGANNVIVTAGVLAVTRLANSTVNSSIGRTNVATTVASITLDAGALNYINGGAAASSTDRLLQIGRTTAARSGTIRNNATNAAETLTFSNPNAILYGTVDQTRTLVLGGTNTGLNSLVSPINNNGTGVVAFTKQDSGTWVISATNSYTGVTTVSGGKLVLDYSTNDTSKLSDTVSTLSLGGGTLDLSGGSHTEVVFSTTLAAATSSFVTRSSGTAVLQMNAITPNTGTLNFGAENIATTDSLNSATTGIIGAWATVGDDWAINSGSTTSFDPTVPGTGIADGFIRAYTGYTDVTRLDSGTKAIANGTTANVRIVEGTGAAADITLASSPTAINTLNQSISGGTGNATIALGGQTLRANGILMGSTVGSLTIGTSAGSGTLTSTAATGSVLVTNNSINPLTINSVIANNTTTSLVKTGAGVLVLNGLNTYTGGTTLQDGTIRVGATVGSFNTNGILGGAFNTGLIMANKSTAVFDLDGKTAFIKDLIGGGSLGGNVTLGSGTLFLTNPSNSATPYNGIISGTGNFSVTGSSSWNTTGAHTYTGITTCQGATLSVSSLPDGGIPSGIGQSSSAASNLVFTGGILAYNNTSSATTNREFTLGGNCQLNVGGAGAITWSSTAAITHSVSTAKTLSFGGNGAGLGTLAAAIGDNTGATSVTKNGTSTWALPNAGSTFTGDITLNTTTAAAGTLSYASAGGANAIKFNQTTSTATLSYIGSGQTMSGPITASALTTGTITLAASGSGAINYSNIASLGSAASGIKNLILSGTNTGNNTLAGAWVDNTGAAATVTKNGAGTWVLSGTNTYTGSTTVSAGTLVAGSSSLGTGPVSVASGATLSLAGGSFVNVITLPAGSLLTGSGTVTSASDTIPSTVSPGTVTGTTGTITFTNTVLALGGTCSLDIGGTTPGSFDVIGSNGNIALTGTVNVAFINGFVPAAGQFWDLFAEDTGFTSTATLNLPTLAPNLQWNSSSFATTGAVSIEQLSLGASPSVSSFAENAASPASVITISVPVAPLADLVVAITATVNGDEVTVPASVTILAGQTSATFDVAAVMDGIFDGSQAVTLGLSATGYNNGAVNLTVTDVDLPPLSASPSVPSFTETAVSPASVVTVSVPVAPVADLVVAISATANGDEVTVPGTVTILAGQTSATFDVAAVNDGIADGNQVVTLSFAAAGYTTGTTNLTVTDVGVSDPVAAYTATFGLTGNNALPDADPDGDGISNAMEYALGINPTSNNGPEYRGIASTTSGALTLTYRRPLNGVSGVTYGVEFKTADLVVGNTGWTTAVLNTDYTEAVTPNGDGTTETVTISLTGPVSGKKFARVSAAY